MTAAPAVLPPDGPCLVVDATNVLRRFSAVRQQGPFEPADRFLALLASTTMPGQEVLAAWDTGRTSQWRRELLPEYKAHRRTKTEVDPEERFAWDRYRASKDVLTQVLPALGVGQVWADGVEADDLIYHVVCREPGRTGAVVLSSDRDLAQLLAPPATRGAVELRDPGGMRWSAANWACDTHSGVPATRWVEFRCLMGDKSDGVPGLPRIGEARAAQLIGAFPRLSAMVAAALEPWGPAWIKAKAFDGLRDASAPAALVRNLKLMDLARAPAPAGLVYTAPTWGLEQFHAALGSWDKHGLAASSWQAVRHLRGLVRAA